MTERVAPPTPGMPGSIEVDREPRVRFTLPQEWFTLRELAQFAKFLLLVAEENEPSLVELDAYGDFAPERSGHEEGNHPR